MMAPPASRLVEYPGQAADDIGDLVLERSHDVLWSLAPTGIVLHQVKRGSYLELDENGYRLWGYLDGARSAAIAADKVAAGVDLLPIVADLFAHGFVVERRC